MSLNEYSMPTGVQIPPATDYRQNQTASSRHRFRRVLGEGSQAQAPFAVQLSSTTDINFRFGAGYVINLAETRLRISEVVQSSTAALSRWTRALPPIAAIRLQTSSGVVLFDLQNFDAFMNVIYPFSERISEKHKQPIMLTPQWTDAKGANSFSPIGNAASGYPGGANLVIPTTGPVLACGTTSAAGTNGYTVSSAVMEPGGPFIVPGSQAFSKVSGTTITAVAAKSLQGGNAYSLPNTTGVFIDAPLYNNYIPRQYIPTISNASKETSVSDYAQNYFQWDVPLRKLLPHTICAALQDLYFGTDLLLTVSFQTALKRMFDGALTDGTDPAYPDYVPGVRAALSSGAAVSSLTGCYYATDLQLATQDNQDLVNSVKQEIAGKGIRIPIQQPFISPETVAQPSNGNTLAYSRVLRLNIARGAALLKSYMGFMNNVSVASTIPMLNRALCNYPISVSTVTLGTAGPAAPSGAISWLYPQWQTYRAFLNAVPMSDSSMDPRDKWAQSRAWIRDCFCEDFRAWLWLGGVCVEDFTSGFDLRKTTPEGGLPLANPIDIQMDATVTGQATNAPSAMEHIFIGVMLKYLSISPAGVTCESA